MASSKLQDDLLHEFREEKNMINAQISLFDPLAVSLRKPAARRLAAKGSLIFGELLCWLAILGIIATCIFLNRLYPFYILFRLKYGDYGRALGTSNVELLQWSVYGLLGLIALLLLFLSRSLARIRQKNAILNQAGRDIKTLVGQHLARKAAIEAVEQRHFEELPLPVYRDVNDIPNPGYGEGSIQQTI